jgi:acetyl esterase
MIPRHSGGATKLLRLCRPISFRLRNMEVHPAVDVSKLHPGIKVFLDKLNALPPVDPARVAVADRRKMFAAFAGTSNGELDFLPRIDDHMAELEAGVVRHIRVYYPRVVRDGDAPLRCYLFLHGGGWHAGSVSTHDPICRRLAAASGCAIAALDYRLAPEHIAPAAVEDCGNAFRWLVSHATALGISASHIGLVGDSAGANVVAGAALGLCNAEGAEGVARQPRPAALALLYPSLDLTTSSGPSYEHFANGFYLRSEAIHHYVRLYLEGSDGTVTKGRPLDAADPRVSPLLAPAEHLERLPPTFISSAGYDPLLSDAEAFEKRLRACGVAVRHTCEADAIHVWMHLVAQVGEDILLKLRSVGREMGALMPGPAGSGGAGADGGGEGGRTHQSGGASAAAGEVDSIMAAR